MTTGREDWLVEEAVISLGSAMCGLFHLMGILDATIEACSDPRDMAVFGWLMLFLSGIAATMLLAIGRSIKPS